MKNDIEREDKKSDPISSRSTLQSESMSPNEETLSAGAIDAGNESVEPSVGFIVGDQFAELTQLPGVFTVEHFFKHLFESCKGEGISSLPKYRTWIIGQGISSAMRYVLYLCEKYSGAARFQFTLPQVGISAEVNYPVWEWHQCHFTEATQMIAELKLLTVTTRQLFSQNFIFSAASDLTERACQIALPGSLLVTKQAQLVFFQRLLPLPIRAEVKFHLQNDNKRTLKAVVRFYQDMNCSADIHLHFDLYTKEEAGDFIRDLSAKTIDSFSAHMSA